MSADKHDSELAKYLSGQMTEQERHAFERKALDDPFLQEALEGAESIDPQDFAADVEQLQQKLIASKSRFGWWRVAAVALLFLVGGWLVWTLMDTKPEQKLAKNEETTQKEEPASKDTSEIEAEEVVAEKPALKVSEPVARVEPTPMVVEDKNQGAGARAAAKPVPAQSEPIQIEELGEVDIDIAEVSDMALDEVAAEEFVEKEKVERISGQVTDDFGEPLSGVNVVIKGSTTGVTTDVDGKYQINVYDESALVFSSIGMQSEEVPVGERSQIDIDLESDSKELQEVVVAGYGAFDNDTEGFVEAMPTMGHEEFKKYLEEKLFYPEEAISQGIEGRVVLQLLISRTGNILDIEVKRGLGYGCDEEAIRLIKEGPKWSPATYDGINVESRVRVRVKFELK